MDNEELSLTPAFIEKYYAPLTKDLEVEVRYISSIMGKGLISKRDFHQGDVILVEKPFLVTNIHRGTCNYCFKADNHLNCKNYGVSFVNQCYAQYCSEDCRQKAFQQYHELECCATNPKMERFIEYCNEHDLSNAVAAARAFLHSILAYLRNNKDARDVGNKLELLIDYRMFHSDDLMHVFPEMDEIGQYEYFFECRKLLKEALYNKIDKSLVDSFLTEQTWRRTLGMFALNRQYGCIYRLQSCINHSCTPNCMSFFDESEGAVSLVALQPSIKAGEQLFICYTRNPNQLRRYGFKCNCGPNCLNNQTTPSGNVSVNI
jgi:hypothetical protein